MVIEVEPCEAITGTGIPDGLREDDPRIPARNCIRLASAARSTLATWARGDPGCDRRQPVGVGVGQEQPDERRHV
ncbi:MAG: hypothetical protein ACHQ50_18005, partial [Fimbriimonadales bacterium]